MANESARTTTEVFEDHLARAARGDMAGDIAENYASDVVLLTGLGVFRGRDGVSQSRRALAMDLRDGRFTYVTKLVEGNYAFLEWSGESDRARVDDGADGFVIVDGLIRMQSIHYTVRHRMGVRVPLAHVPVPVAVGEGEPASIQRSESRSPAWGLTTHIVPWEDGTFVRAFEQARAIAQEEGLTINGPKAAARVERILREGGFPLASVLCERTPEQALAHAAEWTVNRDGVAR